MLEKSLDEYFDTFGKNYPLMIGNMKSEKEIIADIKRCIDEKKPAKEPEYKSGVVY